MWWRGAEGGGGWRRSGGEEGGAAYASPVASCSAAPSRCSWRSSPSRCRRASAAVAKPVNSLTARVCASTISSATAPSVGAGAAAGSGYLEEGSTKAIRLAEPAPTSMRTGVVISSASALALPPRKKEASALNPRPPATSSLSASARGVETTP